MRYHNPLLLIIFRLAQPGYKMIANTALILGKRRLEIRFDCEAKVKWSYFNKRRYFDAKIINCSPNGNYFESPHEIKPGATILIRLENLLSKIIRSDDPMCLRTVYQELQR